jgi:hypothetical protein
MPDQPDVGRGRRPPTWLEELAHLQALARRPAGIMDDGGGALELPTEEEKSADQLAAFLLSQVDLGES